MKQEFRMILILFLVLAMLLTGLAAAGLAWFNWNIHKKTTLIDTQAAPSGGYSLRLEQIGEPIFFAPAAARITLWRNEGSQPLVTLEASVSNDGASLYPENWEVIWQDDRIVITLKGCEQADAIYELALPQSG